MQPALAATGWDSRRFCSAIGDAGLYFPRIGGHSAERGREGIIVLKSGNIAVTDFHFGRRTRENVAILIAIADGNDLVESLPAHGAGVHSEAASKIAGDPLHPLEAAYPGVAGDRGELLQFKPDSGSDFRAIDAKARELAS